MAHVEVVENSPPSISWSIFDDQQIPAGSYVEFDLEYLTGITPGWPTIEYRIKDADDNVLAVQTGTSSSQIFGCANNCFSCDSPVMGSCDVASRIDIINASSEDSCMASCDTNSNCTWFSFCRKEGCAPKKILKIIAIYTAHVTLLIRSKMIGHQQVFTPCLP